MSNILGSFPTEKVKLLKKNGEVYENIEALVESKKIFIDDATVPVEEEDIIERTLPTGSKEQFIVVDRGFHKGMFDIPDHYQIKVEKCLHIVNLCREISHRLITFIMKAGRLTYIQLTTQSTILCQKTMSNFLRR